MLSPRTSPGWFPDFARDELIRMCYMWEEETVAAGTCLAKWGEAVHQVRSSFTSGSTIILVCILRIEHCYTEYRYIFVA